MACGQKFSDCSLSAGNFSNWFQIIQIFFLRNSELNLMNFFDERSEDEPRLPGDSRQSHNFSAKPIAVL
jgi:hypothetical protein